MEPVPFNDRRDPLALLLTRRSGKARDLVEPGPTEAELETILSAAARVPDHGKLAPWRFVVVTDRDALAARILDRYRAEKPDAGRQELDALARAAAEAPRLVILVSTPRASHIPLWEQQLSAGAAAQNLLMATHALGYAGNWLTGPAAYLDGLADDLGAPGGRIAGFFHLGTAAKPLEERPRPLVPDIVRRWP
jgi:nitroreductase